MTNNYDLTTSDGWKDAVAHLRGIPVIGTMYAQHLWVAEKIIDAVSPGKGVEKQAIAAADLIRAGKEGNAEEMTITMSEQAGLHLDVPIDGVAVKCGLGSKGKTTVHVKYARPEASS